MDKPALLKDDPLANLPFFVDGDFVVSETLAIIRYVCAKWGPHLLGSTPQQAAQHDSALCSIYYANNNLRSYCYGYLPQSRVKVVVLCRALVWNKRSHHPLTPAPTQEEPEEDTWWD